MSEIIIPKVFPSKTSAEIIIKSFALQQVKTEIYKPGVLAAEAKAKPVSRDSNFQMPTYPGKDKVLYLSKLGTPVFTNLEVQGDSYTRDGVLYDFDTLIFDTILLTVYQQKNIIKTPIQGRNGTVKEYISDGDYSVNIKGVLTSENGKYPLGAVAELKKALNAPLALRLNSWFLQNLDINSVVVENYSFPQMEGYYSQQAFEINSISDLPVELKIAQ